MGLFSGDMLVSGRVYEADPYVGTREQFDTWMGELLVVRMG